MNTTDINMNLNRILYTIELQCYLRYKTLIYTKRIKAKIPGHATTNVRRLGSVKNCPCKNMVQYIKLKSKYNLFPRLSPQRLNKCGMMYRNILKHPFRQDGHVRLVMDQQSPYFYTDNFSCYLIVGHLS